MTDDELSALRAAAEANAGDAWVEGNWGGDILRLLAHVEALTAQVADRDVLLREVSEDAIYIGEIELSDNVIDRIDALLGGER